MKAGKQVKKIKNNLLQNFKISGIVFSFPIMMFLLLDPVEIYIGNISDFDFLLRDFVWVFLAAGIILWIMGTFFISLLPKKGNLILCSFIFAVSFMSYLQNMFLNHYLLQFDGSQMNWDGMHQIYVVNLLIWILVIAVVFTVIIRLKSHQEKVLKYASMFFLFIQLVAFISCCITAANSGKMPGGCELTSVGRFDVAPNDNIIVLVLDSMSNDMFERCMEEYPEITEELKDFTYYNNYDSLYVPTFPSMSHMLTGNEPEVSEGRYHWLETAWESDTCESFYSTLHNNGYTCYLYSGMIEFVYGSTDYLQGNFDNIRSFTAHTDYRLMCPMMIKYILYRHLPYAMKARFEVNPENYRGVVYYDVEVVEIDDTNEFFYEKICSDGVKIDKKLENAFIIEHLAGMHEPRVMDENANTISYTPTEVQSVRGCFTVMKEYLRQLKELGVYENATIYILADHGTHHGEERQSIYFVKEKGVTRDTMQISSAPITSDEFIPTVLMQIGEDSSSFGTTIYDWEENQIRERTSYYLRKGRIDQLHGYTYSTDRTELKLKLAGEPDIVK